MTDPTVPPSAPASAPASAAPGAADEPYLAPFFALSVDMLCLANTDGYFLKVNPAFVDVLGWSEQELLAHRFLDFVHPADIEQTLATVEHLAAGKRVIDFENRYRCADGSWRWLGWRAAIDPDTGVIYAVARDVTELKQARLEADEARDAAEHASRAKSRFLANMSHELRTPLNAIIGYSEMLMEDVAAEEDISGLDIAQVHQDLDKIRGSGRHLLRLINQVLDLSKVEAGRMDPHLEPIAVAELIDNVRIVVEPLLVKNDNRLVVEHEPGLETFVSDSTMVRQILLNLLSNATKFTERGTIHLRISAASGEMLRFEVEDDGIGMEPDRIVDLFDPFVQEDSSTTRDYGGTGLGLSISRRFCELLGGEIDVESEKGRGTKIWFLLPRQPTTLPRTEGKRAVQRPVGAAGGDVLVIDDDPYAGELFQRLIEPHGLSVSVARSGPEGLHLAEQHRPRLIILDVLMPGMDGWSVLQQLRQRPHLSEVPVVMTSVMDQSELGSALGITAHISKPVRVDELARILKRLDVGQRIPEALVVEDDPDARELLVRLLTREGWRARAAENGLDALEQLRESVPDLVLLDLMMPTLDGFGFLDAVQGDSRFARMQVIVVTARELDRDDLARLNGGVVKVLRKSASLVESLTAELVRIGALEDRV